MHSNSVAVNKLALQSAFAKATKVEHPPAEWLIHLRAQRLNDHRLAVIEAATAAEVAISRALKERLSDLPEAASAQIVKSANGLVGMFHLLELIDGVAEADTKWARIAGRLANPRNHAAHRGAAPLPDVADKAIEESRSILNKYSPLPQP